MLLGAAGAIVGGVFAYAQLQSTMRQRADHARFEQLASSQVTKEARDAAQQQYQYIRDEAGPAGPWERAAEEYRKQQADVNNGGIKTIHWGEGFAVASIETQDGQTLYPTPAPGVWSYFLIAILPMLGFFIPWGVVRAIGWTLAGFFQPAR